MKKVALLSILLIFTSVGCDIIKIKSKKSAPDTSTVIIDNTSAIMDNASNIIDNISTSVDTTPVATKNSSIADTTISEKDNLIAGEKRIDYETIYQDNKTLAAIQLNTESIADIQKRVANLSSEIRSSISAIDNFSIETKLSISAIDNISMNALKINQAIDQKISQLETEQVLVTDLLNKYKKYILIAAVAILSIFIIILLIIIVISGNLKRIKKMIVNGIEENYHRDENLETTINKTEDDSK